MPVHVVVPHGIDDPARPSGGNAYDRNVCRELAASGWSVSEHAVAGSWPRPGTTGYDKLGEVVRRIPDDSVVLLDGLIASTAADVLVPEARRLRLVVLVHMPLGDAHAEAGDDDARTREGAVLACAAAVVTTSEWTRRRLLELYPLRPGRVHVATPAVEAAELAAGTPGGGALICVGAVTTGKGQDLLLTALAAIAELPWRCELVGSLEREPEFAEELRGHCERSGLRGRIAFTGPRSGADLARCYAAADLLVLPSRAETYGMVVTEALARGLPVVAAEVGGVPEALGHGADGCRPGVLVPPDDPAALAGVLRSWLRDADLRLRLRGVARQRRESLAPWSATAAVVAGVLAGAAR